MARFWPEEIESPTSADQLSVEGQRGIAAYPSPGTRQAGDPALRVRTASVIICSWKRPAHLRRALAGVALQSRSPDEVLVCVRPDDSPTRAVLATTAHSTVREILVDRPGVIAARNAG